MMLCIQVAFVKPMNWTSKEITEKDYEILREALDSIIQSNESFHQSKSKEELEHIITLSLPVLTNQKILERYGGDLKLSLQELEQTLYTLILKTADALQLSPQDLKKTLNALIPKAAVALEEKPEVPVKSKEAQPKAKVQPTIELPALLKKAFNATTNHTPGFYESKSEDELRKIIKLSNEALASAEILQAYSQGLNKSTSELESLFSKLIKDATKAVQLLTQGAQEEVKPAPLDTAPSAQDFRYSLYIMLDVPDVNSKGQPIEWQGTIDKLKSQINMRFEAVRGKYYHITLAWYKSKDQFKQEFLSKVGRALDHAKEILHIVYPDGVRGISLVDEASLLGSKKNAVVFRVAASNTLKNIQEIILKFLSFEGITDFSFNTFEIKSPIHVTLGRIFSQSKPSNLQDIVQSLDAPDGTRKSQGESFIAKMFRASYSSGNNDYQEINEYAF